MKVVAHHVLAVAVTGLLYGTSAIAQPKTLEAALARGDASGSFNLRYENVSEDNAFVEMITRRVVENDDSITKVELESLFPLRVGVVFCNPESAFRVPTHRDGILHVRLRSKHLCCKAFW